MGGLRNYWIYFSWSHFRNLEYHSLTSLTSNRVVCASVRPSVTSDKVHVRPIRVNVLLTLNKVNLDLLCPRWLPHRCHIAATLNGRGCCGRIRLAEGRIRWWRGAYAWLRGAYACRRGAYACPRGAYVCARGAHSCLRGAYGFNMLLQKLTHTVV
jgi:hypothetical protein